MRYHSVTFVLPIISILLVLSFAVNQISFIEGSNSANHTSLATGGVFPSAMMYSNQPPDIDPEKGYAVIEIADGLYWVTTGNYEAMFLTTGEGVIAVDAPPTIGDNYLKAISEVTNETVTHLIYSHIHKDHIGAANLFPDNITIIASEQTKDHLLMKNDSTRPIPTLTFEDTLILSKGNQTLRLHQLGDFHSKGDIVVYAPNQKVIMATDMFHPKAGPFKSFATPDINVLLAVHDRILGLFDFDLILTGHEPILGTPEDVKINKQFMMSVLDNSIRALEQVNATEIMSQYDEPGEGFVAYNDVLANFCTDETLAQWETRLSNLDTYMKDNCEAMISYARVD